ncbi:MAG: hypothetical protein HGB18_03015 [Candidatus Moranbacteria bacterium]|nr:hypothetical protein [Candidatus Moranbacteria bacterium]
MEREFVGASSIAEQERSRRRRVFLDSCAQQLQMLEQEGVFPSDYIEARFAAAKLLSGDFEDPEAEGESFAKLGMEERKRFLGAIDRLVGAIRPAVARITDRLDGLERGKLAGIIWKEALPVSVQDIREHLERPWREFLDVVRRWKEDQLSLLLSVENPDLDRLTRAYENLFSWKDSLSDPTDGTDEGDLTAPPSVRMSEDGLKELFSFAEDRLLRKADDFLGRMDDILRLKGDDVLLLPEFEESLYVEYRKLSDRLDAFHGDSAKVQKWFKILDQLTRDSRWNDVFKSFDRAIARVARRDSGDKPISESDRG